jgi:adenosylhomocysteine nucleosidase
VATELICVLFALDREAMYFRGAFPRRQVLRGAPYRGWLTESAGQRVLVLVTGMGALAVRRALDWALGNDNISGRINLVISAGFCGALIEAIAIGSLIQPGEVINADGAVWPVTALPRVGRAGRLISVAVPVLTAQGRRALHTRTAAVAVDMESAAMARQCQAAGVKFACLRAVSDGVEAPISQALSAAINGEHVSLPRLIRAVLSKPCLIGELRRLARDSRAAARSLAAGLTDLLGAEISSP